jgi:hypothetical protein
MHIPPPSPRARLQLAEVCDFVAQLIRHLGTTHEGVALLAALVMPPVLQRGLRAYAREDSAGDLEGEGPDEGDGWGDSGEFEGSEEPGGGDGWAGSEAPHSGEDDGERAGGAASARHGGDSSDGGSRAGADHAAMPQQPGTRPVTGSVHRDPTHVEAELVRVASLLGRR